MEENRDIWLNQAYAKRLQCKDATITKANVIELLFDSVSADSLELENNLIVGQSVFIPNGIISQNPLANTSLQKSSISELDITGDVSLHSFIISSPSSLTVTDVMNVGKELTVSSTSQFESLTLESVDFKNEVTIETLNALTQDLNFQGSTGGIQCVEPVQLLDSQIQNLTVTDTLECETLDTSDSLVTSTLAFGSIQQNPLSSNEKNVLSATTISGTNAINVTSELSSNYLIMDGLLATKNFTASSFEVGNWDGSAAMCSLRNTFIDGDITHPSGGIVQLKPSSPTELDSIVASYGSFSQNTTIQNAFSLTTSPYPLMKCAFLQQDTTNPYAYVNSFTNTNFSNLTTSSVKLETSLIFSDGTSQTSASSSSNMLGTGNYYIRNPYSGTLSSGQKSTLFSPYESWNLQDESYLLSFECIASSPMSDPILAFDLVLENRNTGVQSTEFTWWVHGGADKNEQTSLRYIFPANASRPAKYWGIIIRFYMGVPGDFSIHALTNFSMRKLGEVVTVSA